LINKFNFDRNCLNLIKVLIKRPILLDGFCRLMCLFKSNTFIEKGVQTYTGTAGQQRVSKDFIENYVIGLPPIEEQKRIVEKVNKVWKTINEIECNMILSKL
jgi:hypothetical protein